MTVPLAVSLIIYLSNNEVVWVVFASHMTNQKTHFFPLADIWTWLFSRICLKVSSVKETFCDSIFRNGNVYHKCDWHFQSYIDNRRILAHRNFCIPVQFAFRRAWTDDSHNKINQKQIISDITSKHFCNSHVSLVFGNLHSYVQTSFLIPITFNLLNILTVKISDIDIFISKYSISPLSPTS